MISLYNILFTEAAKSIEDAESNKFGLYILRESGYVNLVLYDTELFYKTRINNEELFDNNPVYAYISLRNDYHTCGAWMVSNSVGKDKFGPLIYDLGMSIINAPIMSDRNSVSTKAQSVWDYMFSHSEKYRKINLEQNDEDCKSYIQHHDKGIKIINKIPYTSLYLNHKKLISKLQREFNDVHELQMSEQLLLELGVHLFNSSV